MDNVRLVWVQIIWVPPHSWCEDFYKNIVGRVGSHVNMDDPTRKRERFDIGRVLISATSPEAINIMLKVKINNGLFFIRLLEESLCVLIDILNPFKP